MITLHQISKKYDQQVVLDVPALEIASGDCIGLVGNNGAGKTTMLSVILDLIKSNTGVAKLRGVEVHRSSEWKQYTGAYLDENFLITHLTPWEYLSFVGSLHGMQPAAVKQFIDSCAGFFEEGLFKRRKYIRDLSTGNKNKVGILSALLQKPELLILDEPFASLDPTSQAWLKKRLIELKGQKVTMILSSHDLNHVTEVSSRVILLEDGQVSKDLPTTQDTLAELENYFMV